MVPHNNSGEKATTAAAETNPPLVGLNLNTTTTGTYRVSTRTITPSQPTKQAKKSNPRTKK